MPFVNGFAPSQSAPLFHNGPWPAGLDLDVTLEGLPAVSIDVTAMGLCGGMSFLARDIAESGTPQLRGTDPTRVPVPVARHILHRLIDSFLGPGVIARWVHVTSELDHETWFWGRGLFAETVEAAHEVMAAVDAGVLVPIGVVLAQSVWPWDVFQNHVELVYGYDLDGGQLTLHVYDCNAEGSDRVTVSLDISTSAPAKPVSTNGTAMAGQPGRIRGFFVLPYQHADPAPAYLDDATVSLTTAPPAEMAPGETAAVTVTVENTGSTTLDPALGYHLGMPATPASGWGTDRVELAGPTDPGQVTAVTTTLVAPAAGTADLQVQAARDGGPWFGRPSEVARVNVTERSARGADEPDDRDALATRLAELRADRMQIDWSDPFTARRESSAIAREMDAISRRVGEPDPQGTARARR